MVVGPAYEVTAGLKPSAVAAVEGKGCTEGQMQMFSWVYWWGRGRGYCFVARSGRSP